MAANLKYRADETKFIESMQKMSASVGKLAADVNIKLNKNFKESDFLTRKLDQGFGKLGGQMKSFGRAMTIGVTLPLALAAKSASDAFAEYDSLRRALQSYHPTLDGLNSRLAEMRTLAKLPGLGFQEAIQGDVRLQAVGISAKNSSKILREFANAIAQTGGGKAQLNEVTIQLGQMAAKGKVLNQDLRPIIESAPAVATALKNMFGTVSSEDISNKLTAAGKSSTEFIEMLLGEMEKAPRVTGGWKNSLENLSDALFISKARIFEVTNELFNLNGKVDSFSDTLEGLVDGFTSLPPVLQGALIGLTAVAAIMGPLSWGVGSLVVLLPKLLTAAYATTLAIGGLTLGIGALAAYLLVAKGESESFNKSLNSVTTSHRAAQEAVDAETVKIEGYIRTLADAGSSVEDLTDAKNELKKISPEFSSALKTEKADIDKLNDAYFTYKDRIVAVAEAKLLSADLDKLVARKTKLEAGDIGVDFKMAAINKTASNFLTFLSPFGDANDLTTYKENIKGFSDNLINETEIGIDSITKKLKELSVVIGEDKTIVEPVFGGKASGDASKKIKDFFTNQKNVLKEESEKFLAEQARLFPDFTEAPKDPEFAKGVKTKTSTLAFAAGVNQGEIPTQRYTGDDPLLSTMHKEEMNIYLEDLKRFQEDSGAILTEIGGNFVGNIVQGFTSGNGMKGALGTLLNQLGDFMMQYGKKALVAIKQIKALQTIFNINPAGAGALAKALGLIAAGGAMKGFASGIPALAQGGATSSPILAMLGDNASGKEMVMPWEKTGDFASKIASDLGGGIGGGSMTAVLRGEDIYFSQQRFLRNKG
jgi:tape measure domain-containing protein